MDKMGLIWVKGFYSCSLTQTGLSTDKSKTCTVLCKDINKVFKNLARMIQFLPKQTKKLHTQMVNANAQQPQPHHTDTRLKHIRFPPQRNTAKFQDVL